MFINRRAEVKFLGKNVFLLKRWNRDVKEVKKRNNKIDHLMDSLDKIWVEKNRENQGKKKLGIKKEKEL